MKIKKVIAVLIAFAILSAGILPLTACNKKDEEEKPSFKMAVLSDIHVMSHEQIGDTLTASFMRRDASGQKMLWLSEAIFRTALDEIAASGANALLITGDITDDGARSSHLAVARELKKLEEKGVDVFIVAGNHDIYNRSESYLTEEGESTPNISPADFVEIYSDFGYSTALATYGSTLSYTADIGDNYRLIAMDSLTYGPLVDGRVENRNSPNMTEGLITWTADQVRKAVQDGKTPIGAMHIPLLQHLGPFIDELGFSDSKVNLADEAAAALTDAGLNFLFTGHMHSQDIASYEKDGKVLYDIETASLCNYPSPIRYFESYEADFKITTKFMSGVKEEYFAPYVKASERAAINADFQKYAYDFVDGDMTVKIKGKVDAAVVTSILGFLGMDKKASSTAALASQIKTELIDAFLDLPLYKKDAGNGLSVEKICEEYGVTLPTCGEKTTTSVALSYLKANYKGDETAVLGDNRYTVLKYALYSMFYVINDYGLFDMLGEYNSAVGEIDVDATLETLFTEGKLDLVSLNVGSLLSDIAYSLTGIEFSKDNALAILVFAKMLKLERLAFGIPVQDYIEVVKNETTGRDEITGKIDFSGLLDKALFDVAASGIIIDFGPADNNVSFNKENMSWTKIG